MRVIWQALSRLGIHVCAVYRRALYPSQDLAAPLDPAPAPPTGVRVALGELEQMLRVAEEPAYRLSAPFVRQAFAADHQVVLTYLESTLVAYGWVSYGVTPHVDGWWVEFAQGHRYNYNNYTLPDYRGRHLRGSYGVLRAPDREFGASHSIAFIELHNKPSIRAEERNGGKRAGFACYVNLGWLRCSFSSSGAKAVGFRFVHRAKLG